MSSTGAQVIAGYPLRSSSKGPRLGVPERDYPW